MLIIPKDILFKHATEIMYNVEVTGKWEEFPALIDLIGLCTSTVLLILIDYQSICS